MTTQKTLDLIGELRKTSDKAIVMMTYYNPIYCYKRGEVGFAQDLKAAGADGVIFARFTTLTKGTRSSKRLERLNSIRCSWLRPPQHRRGWRLSPKLVAASSTPFQSLA